MRGLYRPVALAIVFNSAGTSVLCVRSAKNPDDWGFPQGGIELGEHPAVTALREVREEVGLPPCELSVHRYLGQSDLDAEPGRRDRRGFTRGKRYFCFQLICIGGTKFRLDPDEIAEAQWVRLEDVPTRFASTREDKRRMLFDVLSCAVR